ncbi:MAG: hypothetical protein IKO31_01595 [Bacteroidales bacterium]|nr:hypothetical protein [Bacteroidales bacterium]
MKYLLQGEDLAVKEWPAVTLEVAVFRVRVSGIVASELLWRCTGNSTDECKCARLQGPKALGNAYNLFKSIVVQQELPVTYLAIFQHSLNDIWGILDEVNTILVNIPKQID